MLRAAALVLTSVSPKSLTASIITFGRDPRCNRWQSDARPDILVHGEFAALPSPRRCGGRGIMPYLFVSDDVRLPAGADP